MGYAGEDVGGDVGLDGRPGFGVGRGGGRKEGAEVTGGDGGEGADGGEGGEVGYYWDFLSVVEFRVGVGTCTLVNRGVGC